MLLTFELRPVNKASKHFVSHDAEATPTNELIGVHRLSLSFIDPPHLPQHQRPDYPRRDRHRKCQHNTRLANAFPESQTGGRRITWIITNNEHLHASRLYFLRHAKVLSLSKKKATARYRLATRGGIVAGSKRLAMRLNQAQRWITLFVPRALYVNSSLDCHLGTIGKLKHWFNYI